MVLITSLVFLVIYVAMGNAAGDTLGTINPPFGYGTATANTSAQVLDTDYQNILTTQFSEVALMDGFIWNKTEPSQNEFDFSVGDNLVAFAAKHEYGIMAHSLVQTSPSEYTLDESAIDLGCPIGSTRLQTKRH